MVVEMAAEFSEDGKYFAQISTDGKLKIWDTEANSLEQEYTPDFHLNSPCTCLRFLNSDTTKRGISPKKKKRRESETFTSPKIVLGTSSGLLLIYSIAKADVEYKLNSETSQPVSCLSVDDNNVIYSGINQSILVWNLLKKAVESKWKASDDKITSVLVIPNKKLLTASKIIKLWDVMKKEVLKTFVGHSSDVTSLSYILPKQNSDSYFISGGKDDRLLNCWNLNPSADKNAVAHFLMEDIVHNVCVNTFEGSTSLAATVRSGVVHVYEHTLNGKCGKPLKPKTTIQVVSDTGQSKDVVTPIRIYGGYFRDNVTLCIGHGSDIIITFENITLSTFKKIQCLVRKDPRTVLISKEIDSTKVKTPVVNNDVTYLTSQNVSLPASKRKHDGPQEVPMERRLENLTLNKDETSTKKLNNVAHLLLQALHSKDKNMLRTVLCNKDENAIRNTVKKLPITVLAPLVEELTNYIKGKTLSCQIGSVWLKFILQTHSTILISNPTLCELLGKTLQGIESRLSLQMPLNKLRGRLDLLISQVNIESAEENQEEEQPLIFNDKDSSDSEEEGMELDEHSESEHEWEEFEDKLNNSNNGINDDSDNSEDSSRSSQE